MNLLSADDFPMFFPNLGQFGPLNCMGGRIAASSGSAALIASFVDCNLYMFEEICLNC